MTTLSLANGPSPGGDQSQPMVATIKPVHLACMRTGPKATIYEASCDGSAKGSYDAAMQIAVAADVAAGGGATAQQDAVRGRGVVDH
jgi:predicted ATPase